MFYTFRPSHHQNHRHETARKKERKKELWTLRIKGRARARCKAKERVHPPATRFPDGPREAQNLQAKLNTVLLHTLDLRSAKKKAKQEKKEDTEEKIRRKGKERKRTRRRELKRPWC